MKKEILKLGKGSVMRCINSDLNCFKVGENYITGKRLFIGNRHIGIGRFIVNYHKNGYFGIDDLSGVIARFVLVKDSKGRYAKHDTKPNPHKDRRNGKRDARRFRRYARQMLKRDKPGTLEYKVISNLARNVGK